MSRDEGIHSWEACRNSSLYDSSTFCTDRSWSLFDTSLLSTSLPPRARSCAIF